MAITKITTPELFNLQSNNTEGTRLPVMTTTQRNAMTSMSNGELIFNSTTDSVEYYDLGAAAWYKIDYDPLENFNTVLYTGNGSAQTLNVSTIGFQPDLVWLKQRTGSLANHLVADTVRGPWKIIYPNIIYSSDRTSVDKAITSFADGFTVKDTTQGTYECNGPNGGTYSGNGTYVAWCFKAGGAAVANTNGSINSQVSVNDTLGFSIAKYTGNTTSGATVGHGLSSTPELILFKTLESGPGYAGWAVQVASLGGDKYLILNESQQAYSGTGYFNDTLADSDVITLGSFDVTNDGTDIIAYSFASKPGFSKVGTYTGNGGNNPVDVGFEPAFVMIKNTTSSASWAMFDNKRTTANPSTSALYANEAIIEEDLQLYFEFTSTGFKNLQSSNTLNTSSSIYIYLAFAK